MGWDVVFVILLVLLAAFVGVDLYLTTDAIDGNTFSELLREYGSESPIFPWTLSALSGRWFHPGDRLQPAMDDQGWIYATIVGVTVLVVLIGIGYKVARGKEEFIPPWLVVPLGLVFGAVVAPMSPA